MFFLTDKTKGGFTLMGLLFFCAFVMAVTLYVDVNSRDSASSESCASISECMFTMLRLTFYDGTGFDFALSLTEQNPFLFFLVMVYMCMTSFGIINGLLSIFASSFGSSGDVAFNPEDRANDFEEMKA